MQAGRCRQVNGSTASASAVQESFLDAYGLIFLRKSAASAELADVRH